MTLEEAKKEIPTFESFAHQCCNQCKSEWYCPTYCDMLEKAKKMDLERIQKCYAKHEQDIVKVVRYIHGAKIEKTSKKGY